MMEMVIDPEAIRNELRVFSNVISKDTTLTEIRNLFIDAKQQGELNICGTDLDTSLEVQIPAETFDVVSPGEVCLNAHKLIDMLGALDGNVKSVKLKEEANGWTSALFKRSHFKIAGIKANLFPPIKMTPDEAIPKVIFPAGLLLQFIESTNYAVAAQDTKFTLTGANLEISDTGSRMVATDGFRVATITAQIAGTFKTLIPKKTLNVIARLLMEIPAEQQIEICSDDNLIYVNFGNKQLSCRKMVANFPDVSSLVNLEHTQKVKVNFYEIRSAVKRASLFADKSNLSNITITVRNNEVELFAKSFEEGSGNELLDAEYTGSEIKMKLKSSHLVDFFSSLQNTDGNTTLSIDFSENQRIPTVWKVHHDGNVETGFDYKCVITQLQ